MADVTHYARARTALESPDNDWDPGDEALLNACLAVSTALRETSAAVMVGLRDVAGRVRDAADTEPDAALLRVTDVDGHPVWVSLRHVVAVTQAPGNDTGSRIILSGMVVDVDTAVDATAQQLGVAA